MDTDNTLVMINSYGNLQEAYIDKGFLENHDIPCEVYSSALSSIFPGPIQPSNQICLYVPQPYEKEALKLLMSRPKE